MAVAVKIDGLTKTYKLLTRKEPVNAVSNLNLKVEEGEIFGFLGPNGAGKTTTIKMLLGLVYPSKGTASILGKPAGDIQIKRQISYLPETPYFYDYMTGQEILTFYGRLFGLSESVLKTKTVDLLKTVGLYNDRNKPLSQYSKGMLQRVGIAQALVNDPKLLILDEPTSGLDPLAHSDIRDLILRLKDEGKTVFLSSHQLSDVEMVCDRVAILNRGKLLKVGHLNEILSADYVEIRATEITEDVAKKLKAYVGGIQHEKGYCIISQSEGEHLTKTIDLIRSCNAEVLSVVPQRKSLEDIFVELIREVNK
ncbi:MAG TPA: ABC transporter ATP-binding protein [Armatimonadota bacterium]|jgi:ABC-2 type transport system ATP-binding protein